jgi:hypothetical protein
MPDEKPSEPVKGNETVSQKDTLQMNPEDTTKAKKKGSLFGDPIFIVE